MIINKYNKIKLNDYINVVSSNRFVISKDKFLIVDDVQQTKILL